MTIVFISVTGELGGAERVLLGLVRGLRQQRPDWRIHAVLSGVGPLSGELDALGIRPIILPFPEAIASLGEGSAEPAWKLLRQLPAAISYCAALRRTLRELAPNIVHSNGFKLHALAATCLPAGAKLVWHVHDFVTNRPIMSRTLRWLSKQPQAVIGVSRAVADDLRRVVRMPERVRTVWNAVDLARFSPGVKARPADGLIRIGLVATFARWKGHETFFRALAQLPADLPCFALVIGGPLYRTEGSQYSPEELNKMAQELGVRDRVSFTGFLRDAAHAIRLLDIVVHASTEPEPFGLVVAEAVACGRALITTRNGGAAELLTDGRDCLMHHSGDAAGLSQAMLTLVRSAELRRCLGLEARQTAERLFSSERHTREVIAIYESA